MPTRPHPARAAFLTVLTISGAAAGCASHAESAAHLRTITPTTRSSVPGTPARPSHRPVTERDAVLSAVRRYYVVLNSLHTTMNAGAMRSLFTSRCPCQAQVRAIATAAADGEHFVDRASINVMRPSLQGPRQAFVLVNLDTARGGLSRADGTRVTTAAPQRGVQRVFRLVLVHQRWLIDRIEVG